MDQRKKKGRKRRENEGETRNSEVNHNPAWQHGVELAGIMQGLRNRSARGFQGCSSGRVACPPFLPAFCFFWVLSPPSVSPPLPPCTPPLLHFLMGNRGVLCLQSTFQRKFAGEIRAFRKVFNNHNVSEGCNRDDGAGERIMEGIRYSSQGKWRRALSVTPTPYYFVV